VSHRIGSASGEAVGGTHFDGVRFEAIVTAGVQVLFQVLIQKLEDERQLLLRMHDIVQPANHQHTEGGSSAESFLASGSARAVAQAAYRTMLGCCNCFSREISRMAVEGMPAEARGREAGEETVSGVQRDSCEGSRYLRLRLRDGSS
jgi:hypothetical protein